MKTNVYAVITGDLVASTTSGGPYKEVLQQLAEEIKQEIAPDMLVDIYRGDSFQVLLSDPALALNVALLFRTGLRRHSRGNTRQQTWDGRLSIGIGSIASQKFDADTRVGTLDGEAFVRSGRALDTMKENNRLLQITLGNAYDDEFAAACPMADAIIGRWTTQQADAIYYTLLATMTQQEIGKKLGKSQRAIGKRLEASDFQSLQPFIKRYKQVIAWNYSK